MERKVWGKRDDEILKYLRQQRGQRKWAAIARIMQQEFDIPGRTGTHLDRYHNHLDANIVNGEWTEQQEDMLFELHGEMGNKWSLIALKLPGRADNCVKNHFYSKLRKALRKLNKIIEEYFANQFSILKSSTLSEIIQITESKFKMNSKIDEDMAQFCNGIKNRLFKFRYVDGEFIDQQTLVQAKALIQDIDCFSKDFNKCHKSRQEQKKLYRAYLKPPLVKKSVSQNSGSSENNSEDNFLSNFSSASRMSSCSDLSEYDQVEKEKPGSNNSTGPRSQGQISRHYSDRQLNRSVKNDRVHSYREISIEKDERVRSSRELVGSDKNEVDSPLPSKGERVHFNPIQLHVEKQQQAMQVQNMEQGQFQIHEQPLDSEMKQFYYNNNNMFDEIPLIARILAPMQEQRSSLLFRRDGSSDSGDIEFKEERD